MGRGAQTEGVEPETAKRPWEAEPKVELWFETKEHAAKLCNCASVLADACSAYDYNLNNVHSTRFSAQLSQDLKSLCRFARVHEARLHHATQRGVTSCNGDWSQSIPIQLFRCPTVPGLVGGSLA